MKQQRLYQFLFLISLPVMFVPPVHSQAVAQVSDSFVAVKPMSEDTSKNENDLIMRVSTDQRLTLPSPPEGMMVYDTDKEQFYFYDGNEWRSASGDYKPGQNYRTPPPIPPHSSGNAISQMYAANPMTDVIKTPGSGFEEMPGMTVSFTSSKPVVYVLFSAAGTFTGVPAQSQQVSFRMIMNGEVLSGKGASVFPGPNPFSNWSVSLYVPVSVPLNKSVTLSVQWDYQGPAENVLLNNITTQPTHNRSLMVME
ncbi:MAG: hypothetical protein V2A54_16765 [Bacteroidota bacterium]